MLFKRNCKDTIVLKLARKLTYANENTHLTQRTPQAKDLLGSLPHAATASCGTPQPVAEIISATTFAAFAVDCDVAWGTKQLLSSMAMVSPMDVATCKEDEG